MQKRSFSILFFCLGIFVLIENSVQGCYPKLHEEEMSAVTSLGYSDNDSVGNSPSFLVQRVEMQEENTKNLLNEAIIALCQMMQLDVDLDNSSSVRDCVFFLFTCPYVHSGAGTREVLEFAKKIDLHCYEPGELFTTLSNLKMKLFREEFFKLSS